MNYISLIFLVALVSAYSPSVKIENGVVSGTTYKLSNGRDLDAFLGIPFAEPPIGPNRFEAPKPKKPWTGVWHANYSRKACVQFFSLYLSDNTSGDEDCLYLNVFRPRRTNSNKKNRLLDVLVYIHGGGYQAGSLRMTFPDHIMHDADLVYVAIAYRLGPLGFISTNDKVAPGNNGLKDQVEALRWIQKNIVYFGGNSDKVTIIGLSAGASSVSFHLVSPLSKGLFHKAITSSGSSFNPWSLPTKVDENSFELASMLKCKSRDTQSMLLCLKHKPIDDIVNATRQLLENNGGVKLIFGPVIEPKTTSAFISENPRYLLKNGKVKNVPLLTNTVENEGAIFGILIQIYDKNFNRTNKNWLSVAPRLLGYDDLRSKPEQDHISSSIRDFYFQGKAINNQTAKQFFQVLGDRIFYNGIIESAKLYASVTNNNSTYCYKFNYMGNQSVYDIIGIEQNFGVSHSDDHFYLLNFGLGPKPRNDEDVAKLLVSSIIAFIQKGNPSTEDVAWKPIYRNGEMNCLNIYTPTIQKMENIENKEVTDFWNKILPPDYNAIL